MRANGEQPPAHLLPPPPSPEPDVDDFYLDAFFRLSTERAIGMAVGPIPWHHVVAYADRAGLAGEAAELFVQVIAAMDRGYLEHEAAVAKAKEKAHA